MLRRILDVVDLLDTADAGGAAVVEWLRQWGATAETEAIEGPGRTGFIGALVRVLV